MVGAHAVDHQMSSDERPRLVRALVALGGAVVLGSVTMPLPACDHFNCSVDCDTSPHRCGSIDVASCPTDRGCHREPACVCASAPCLSVDCGDFASQSACALNAYCKWDQVCENDNIVCEDIHDGDTCERLVPCATAWDCA